jgi:hypothetical protein
MSQNQTESKPEDVEEPREEGLDETSCSGILVDRAEDLWTSLKDLAYWSDRVNSLQHAGLEILPSTWGELWDSTNRARSLLARLENCIPNDERMHHYQRRRTSITG